MDTMLHHIVRFWKSGLRQINILFLCFSIAVAWTLYLGSKYLARWSRSINVTAKNLSRESYDSWEIDSLVTESSIDVSSLVLPYYWQYKNVKNSKEVGSIISQMDSVFRDVSFKNEYSLFSWLHFSGGEKEEMNAIWKGLSIRGYQTDASSEEYDFPSGKIYYLTKYFDLVYYPHIVSLLRDGDYYQANECINNVFYIYDSADEYVEFYSGMNKMYIFKAVLQDCWEASTHRAVFEKYCNNTIDIENINLMSPKGTKDSNLSEIDSYFDGLIYLRNKDFKEAHSCFKRAYDLAKQEYVKELTAYMIIRSAAWIYDSTGNLADYEYAKNQIKEYSSIIKSPYFSVDIAGYEAFLEDLKYLNRPSN